MLVRISKQSVYAHCLQQMKKLQQNIMYIDDYWSALNFSKMGKKPNTITNLIWKLIVVLNEST